jgi:hypothetical protein
MSLSGECELTVAQFAAPNALDRAAKKVNWGSRQTVRHEVLSD